MNPLRDAIEKLRKVEELFGPDFWSSMMNGSGPLDEDFWKQMQQLAGLFPPGQNVFPAPPAGGGGAPMQAQAERPVAAGPPVDLFLTPRNVIVCISLPGLRDPGDLRASLVGDSRLRVEGTIPPHPLASQPEAVVQQERATGRFSRVIDLPVPVKDTGVGSTYQNGVLELVFERARAEEAKPLHIRF